VCAREESICTASEGHNDADRVSAVPYPNRSGAGEVVATASNARRLPSGLATNIAPSTYVSGATYDALDRQFTTTHGDTSANTSSYDAATTRLTGLSARESAAATTTTPRVG
jgi:hypothetical protein